MIIAIAAVGKNGELGKDGKLPWSIPEDMAYFKESTKGKTVVMGRKTFESLGKPLSGRKNIVLTTDESWYYPGVQVMHHPFGLDTKEDMFIIGGAETYYMLMPYIQEIWLTEIDETFDADTFFPGFKEGKLDNPDFKMIERAPQKAYDTHEYYFCKYVRNVV